MRKDRPFGRNRQIATDFYPALGYRNGGSGALNNVGTGGIAWSSSPLSAPEVRASGLYFDSSYMDPEGNYSSRVLGRPVRCVQE